MFKAIIRSNGVVTNEAKFDTQEEISAWVTENETAFPSDFAAEIVDVTTQDLALKEQMDAHALLDSTDWYVIRQVETGVAIPQTILDSRAAARLKI